MEEQNLSHNEMKRQRAASAARRKRMRTAIIAVVTLVAIGALIWGGIAAVRRSKENTPGESIADQGQQHVVLDYQFSYNSNPPTSGPHFPQPANWGIYDYEASDKFFIHNLEHGGIWISYRPSVGPHVIEHLKALVDEFGGSKIIMVPRAANDTDIAVASWTRLAKFNLVNSDITEEQLDQIRAFYRAFKNHGPEFVPDSMPGVDPKSVQP